jgi:hypothetical protein
MAVLFSIVILNLTEKRKVLVIITMYVYGCHPYSHLESTVAVIVLAVMLSIVILNLFIKRTDIVNAMDGSQL